MSAQHTLTPWIRDEHGATRNVNGLLVCPAGCMLKEDQARMEFCVNTFPDLLQLLTDAGQWLEAGLTRGQISRGTANRDGDLVTQIRAVLAKAKGA